MIDSFQISNFRLFQFLQVERLNRVNLITGMNNSGKSTFLEAIELYASNSSPIVLLDLVKSRQETWFSEAQPRSQNFTGNSVRHLFYGHKLPQVGEQGIFLGEISSNTRLHISVAAYQIYKNDEEGTTRRIRISNLQSDIVDEELSNIEVFLIAEEGYKTRRLFGLDRDIRDIGRYNSRELYRKHESEFKSIC